MNIEVPYLSDEDIEGEANSVLRSFEAKYGVIQSVAVPLDEIIESHLGLTFEFADFGHPAILGQLNIRKNLIRINSMLDPHVDSTKEGRFNYTLAHEGGHHVLHRPYAKALMETPSIFGEEGKTENVILCRIENQKATIEIQADRFASCLLLPKDKVYREFVKQTDRPRGMDIETLILGARRDRGLMDWLFPEGSYLPTENDFLHRWFAGFADQFKVSRQAMVISLKKFGLLKNEGQKPFL